MRALCGGLRALGGSEVCSLYGVQGRRGGVALLRWASEEGFLGTRDLGAFFYREK